MVEREPIAVVGIGFRGPGASSPAELWELLRSGRSAVREVPAERWDAAELYDRDPAAPGTIHCRRGGFLDDVWGFDRDFFRISADEAEAMDPQQRLLLEVAWEAFEDAGWPLDRFRGGPGGAFVGIGPGDYGRMCLGDEESIGPHTNLGNQLSIAANRLSYCFDLRGPSLALDAACSSSLVAVHLACQSLWLGESSFAIAGGVNALLAPPLSIGFSQAGMLSPSGECRSFDRRADGYVRSEGVGLVVLKRQSEAVADGDAIRGLILGSAVGQSGRSNGIGAPHPERQAQVVRAALRDAGVAANDVQYVEAHSVGTAIGDLLEAEALGVALGGATRDAPCAIGSIKTNVGHLETAAGVAGLIKAILTIEHATVPPSLHCTEPNPAIDFERLGLRVPQRAEAWDPSGGAVAGVSSFGFGGTNAHVVIGAPPAARIATERRVPPVPVLPLSARSPAALRQLAADYRCLLDELPDADGAYADVLYSAAAHRTHHRERLAIVGTSPRRAVRALDAWLMGHEYADALSGRATTEATRIVFVFGDDGIGAEGCGPAQAFLRARPQAAAVLRTFEGELSDAPPLWTTQLAEQIAWSALWRSWGAVPDAVVAWGAGEIAGSLAVGQLTPEAIADIARRSPASAASAALAANQRHAAAPIVPFLRVQLSAEPADSAEPLAPHHPSRLPLGQALDHLGETPCVLLPIGALGLTRAELAAAMQRRGSPLRLVSDGAQTLEHSLARAAATLYAAGRDLEWRELAAGGRYVRLPTYRWQRTAVADTSDRSHAHR